MINYLLYLLFIFQFLFVPAIANERDSLLTVLDEAILKREQFKLTKLNRIDSIKKKLLIIADKVQRYEIQSELISEYQSFNCDSALVYIDQNIKLAQDLSQQEWIQESKLRQAFVLSMSGFFTQAWEVFEQIDYQQLPKHLKVLYGWGIIRYHENLIIYTENNRKSTFHKQEIGKFRMELLSLLDHQSDIYLKEKSFQLKAEGELKRSAEIQQQLFSKEQVHTHAYAMSAMGLAMVFRELNQQKEFEHYLILAAITDVKLAIKENESLLTLAIYLHEQGEVNRAYNYIHAALDDANFYNSRFRNSVIARIQPIIEATYIAKIEDQGKNLKRYAILISIIVLGLGITLYILYHQNKTISSGRKKLKGINQELLQLNHRLDEANLIRERYIGYYINQCAVYLDKLDDYRKFVQRKIKSGQIDELIKFTSSNKLLEKDALALFTEFDKSFLEVYPTFVEEFNSLLKEEERYTTLKNQLNTELRIFALIRLGITDVNQIAVFLRYSIQTIYNYKSKVKGKAIFEGDLFEEKVKKIASISSSLF
ncbi:DUF6377 domain-containing protein [Sphingobacterium sp. HJSM2_6]|uniref:DUF6377 domain-containing protein n=1 Tax=Sphingobacterium sp. HJSM2_6 TaxID=3366264 RepID=UPI003BEC180E